MFSKRLIAVNLSAAVLMAVMTGCGNTPAPASDPVSEQQSAEQTSEVPAQSADQEEQAEEKKRQDEMKRWTDHIRSVFKGDEKVMMLST